MQADTHTHTHINTHTQSAHKHARLHKYAQTHTLTVPYRTESLWLNLSTGEFSALHEHHQDPGTEAEPTTHPLQQFLPLPVCVRVCMCVCVCVCVFVFVTPSRRCTNMLAPVLGLHEQTSHGKTRILPAKLRFLDLCICIGGLSILSSSSTHLEHVKSNHYCRLPFYVLPSLFHFIHFPTCRCLLHYWIGLSQLCK